MSADFRDRSWRAVRSHIEDAPLVVLEEAAGALMMLAELPENPVDNTAEFRASRSPAERLVASIAYLLLLETRWRYDTGFEGLTEDLEGS